MPSEEWVVDKLDGVITPQSETGSKKDEHLALRTMTLLRSARLLQTAMGGAPTCQRG